MSVILHIYNYLFTHFDFRLNSTKNLTQSHARNNFCCKTTLIIPGEPCFCHGMSSLHHKIFKTIGCLLAEHQRIRNDDQFVLGYLA